jgi:hypothetical protein
MPMSLARGLVFFGMLVCMIAVGAATLQSATLSTMRKTLCCRFIKLLVFYACDDLSSSRFHFKQYRAALEFGSSMEEIR